MQISSWLLDCSHQISQDETAVSKVDNGIRPGEQLMADFPQKTPNQWFGTSIAGPFADFFARYGRWALVLLAFVAVFRISDYVLGILANPFYLDIGFSKAQIASVATTAIIE